MNINIYIKWLQIHLLFGSYSKYASKQNIWAFCVFAVWNLDVSQASRILLQFDLEQSMNMYGFHKQKPRQVGFPGFFPPGSYQKGKETLKNGCLANVAKHRGLFHSHPKVDNTCDNISIARPSDGPFLYSIESRMVINIYCRYNCVSLCLYIYIHVYTHSFTLSKNYQVYCWLLVPPVLVFEKVLPQPFFLWTVFVLTCRFAGTRKPRTGRSCGCITVCFDRNSRIAQDEWLVLLLV